MSSPEAESQIKTIFTDMENRMSKSIDSLSHNLNSLRTGRATPSLLDSVKVEAYGTLTPINQVGSISAPEPRLLVVQVWDKSLAKAVERAINDADLGLNSSADGVVIRVPIPDLTGERRKEMVKKASEYCEMCKVAIRNVRRDAMDALKQLEKNKKISEDELKVRSTDVQKETDNKTKKADELLAVKSAEIMKV